jgi:hypothetical protein
MYIHINLCIHIYVYVYIGPNYLPAYAEGVRAGLAVVGRHVIGLNPLSLNHLNTVMDYSLRGMLDI